MSEKTIFISYRRDATGKAFAGRIRDALVRSGYDPFFDVDNLGPGDWEQQILAEVPRRSHFILVLTPGSLESCTNEDDWVRREFELAVQSGRNIVPVAEESVSLSPPRRSCPGCMEKIFDYSIVPLRHTGFAADIERLIRDFIPPHKAPPQAAPASTTLAPASAVEAPVVDIAEIRTKLNRVRKLLLPFVNHILDILLLTAVILTLSQGMNNDWRAALLIPITLGMKGVWIMRELPSEIMFLAYASLFAIVCGSTILVGNLQTKKEWQGGIWIAGFTPLAFGLGMATTLAVTQSLMPHRLSARGRD